MHICRTAPAVCRLLSDTANWSRSTSYSIAVSTERTNPGPFLNCFLQPNPSYGYCIAEAARGVASLRYSTPYCSSLPMCHEYAQVQPVKSPWSLPRGYSRNTPQEKEKDAAASTANTDGSSSSSSSRRNVTAVLDTFTFPSEITGFSDVGFTAEEVDRIQKLGSVAEPHKVLLGAIQRAIAEAEEKIKLSATFKAGDILARGRYQLLDKHARELDLDIVLKEVLSWSTIWNGKNLATQQDVVIKVCEAGDPTQYIAATRAAALHVLAGDHPNILRVLDVFEQRTAKGRHACVVLEKAGSNLEWAHKEFSSRSGELIRSRRERGEMCMASSTEGIRALKSIARQLFTALDVLHRRGIIHMDINPEHMLLDKPFRSWGGEIEAGVYAVAKGSRWKGFQIIVRILSFDKALLAELKAAAAASKRQHYQEENLHEATIKLTGFRQAVLYKPLVTAAGSTLSYTPSYNRDGQKNWTPVHLRAPEEILGLDYAAPAYDIWRAGLTIFQLATGNQLFAPGRWANMKRQSKRLSAFENDDHLHLWDMVDTLGNLPRELIRRSSRFNELFLQTDKLKISRVLKMTPAQNDVFELVQRMAKWAIPEDEANAFHHFITSVLVPDPAKRPTAAAVLKHPWLQDS